MPVPCSVSENTVATNQSAFWDPSTSFWDAHRIGWTVAGACTVLVRSFLNLSFWPSCSIFTDNTDIIVYHRTTLQVRSRWRYRNAGIWRIIASSRNYTKPSQQRQMLALVPKPLVCFWLRLFALPVVCAFYTCLQSMPSSHSFHIVFSELTLITHLFKLVRLFKHWSQAQSDLNFYLQLTR